MSKRRDLSVELFIQAIPGSAGIISTIAARCNCAWSTARRFIHMHPTVLAAYNDECERVLDMAESKLYASMNAGNTDDIKWFLARKGKHRGYTDRIEQGHSGELVIRILDETHDHD